MKNFILPVLLFICSVGASAQNVRYVDNSYLQDKGLYGEKLGAVLASMSVDGKYQLSNAYISELDGNISVGKENNTVNFVLIPAAKINYIDNGTGSIQGKYIGTDGVEYEAPTEDWNKFAFFAQRETVQLYYLQIISSDTDDKKYLTSTGNGKLKIQSAIAGNGISALSQMFAIQGNLKVDFFKPPYYGGSFVFSPVVYFSGESGTINTIVGSDNLKDGPVINLTTYSDNDSLFVVSNNRNACEFALMKVDNAVRVTDVILDKESVTLIFDEFDEQRKTLSVTVLPENASDKSINWISGNEDVVTVSENGEISAKSTGITYVKAISSDGIIFDSCVVTVKTSSGLVLQENATITDVSGSIDFSFETPTTNIHSATFSVQLPDGYNLIDNGISLADELTSIISVDVERVNGNEWRVSLSPKETDINTRNASLFKKILDINYSVDADLANGFYEIIVKNIDIKDGNDISIQEDQLIVPSNILRSTTGNPHIDETTTVFCYNGELVINNNHTERIQVYSITGALLYSGQVNGTISIPANNFTDIFIVKSSAGWTKKIAKR